MGCCSARSVKFLNGYCYCCAAGARVSDRMRIVQVLVEQGKEKCRGKPDGDGDATHGDFKLV